MSTQTLRRLGSALALLLSLSALAAAPAVRTAAAAPIPSPNPIDVPFYSQLDPRWTALRIGRHEDVSMLTMGSLLTCLAMLASAHGLQVITPVDGTGPDFLPTPDYIHLMLREKGGYRASPPRTVIVDYYSGLARAFQIPLSGPAGLLLIPKDWPTARRLVDGDLAAGSPANPYVQLGANRFHPVVVVGWDVETGSYLVHDPARLRWHPSPVPMRHLHGAGWEGKIAGALLATVLLAEEDDDFVYPLFSLSTKSPVETVAIDPDGRRVGYDVATGSVVVDVAEATYLPLPVWADPTGQVPDRAPGRLLTIPSAVDGRYRFEMIGIGDGPFTLSLRVHDLAGEVVLDESLTGTVTKGQVLKFQVEHSSTGPSRFTRGDNFRPEARAGGARASTRWWPSTAARPSTSTAPSRRTPGTSATARRPRGRRPPTPTRRRARTRRRSP